MGVASEIDHLAADLPPERDGRVGDAGAARTGTFCASRRVMIQAAMERFESWDGIEIAYQEWGTPAESPPVLLHHGFVANANANWVATGVVDALLAAGHRVIAPDARGHGASEKPHDPGRYGEQRMARDLAALLEVVGESEIDLVGYSMGAVVALLFAQ